MRHTAIEREARVERVKDLRAQGLSLRQIVVELEKEGYPISLHQVQLDLQATAPSATKSTFPFWCFEKIQGYPNCCFCHKVHLPLRADGEKSTLYDYQYNIFRAMEDNTYLTVVKSRQIGITTIVLYGMLYYAIYGFMKGYKSLIIPGTKAALSEDHIGNMKSIIEIGEYTDLIDPEKTRKDRIIFKDKTEIRAMPSNTTTVRGLAVKFVFLDEAAMFDDIEQREILNSIRPLIATTRGKITMISTPKGRRGIFYAVVTSDSTWNKMYLPYTVSLNKLLPAETIDSEMKSPTVDFQQEYNNQFSTPQNAVYTQAFIDSHKGDYELIEYAPNDWRLNEPLKTWMQTNGKEGHYIHSYSNCLAGVDVGSIRDFTSLVVLAQFDKTWKPLVCKLYQPGWPAIIEDFEKLAKELNIQQFAIDTTAFGKDFADMVVGKSLHIDPVSFTSQNKTEMINHCKKLLVGQELSLPKNGCPELLLQFGEQQKSDIGGGRIKYSHPETRQDDMLWAFHLACKLVGEHAETVIIML